MSKKITAIQGSIKKWEGILAGEEDITDGFSACPMCSEFIDKKNLNTKEEYTPESCSACPLQIAGNGCLEVGSLVLTFDSVERLIDAEDDEGDDVFTLPDLQNTAAGRTLKTLAQKMLNNLNECLVKAKAE